MDMSANFIKRNESMNISFLNHEHYPDPTAYEAFKNIEMENKDIRDYRYLVYICSPFSGNVDENVKKARKYCRFAVESWYIPISKHLYYNQFMNDDDKEERKLAMFFGNALMSKCSEIWVFGENVSSGMASEIKRAKWKNYRIRYFDSNCREVRNNA